jgi:hypothetical protein
VERWKIEIMGFEKQDKWEATPEELYVYRNCPPS